MADPGPLRVVIADDEPVARDGLRAILADDPEVEVVGAAATGREAVAVIRDTAPDLVLLDIRMPEMDGFEVLESIERERPPAVVFVTAYDEFAVRAFEVHALDYVLKPFGDRRLRRALDRVKERIRLGRAASLGVALETVRRRESAEGPEGHTSTAEGAGGDILTEDLDVDAADAEARSPGGLERITVRRGRRTLVVSADEIDWIEGAGDYARLHVDGERHLVRRTLRRLARELDPDRFARIHRSVLVNLSRIESYYPISHGDYAVILHDGTRLRVSRTRRRAFLRRLRGGRDGG